MTDPTDPIWNRWAEVDRLFEAALDRAPDERDRFLEAACADDTELLELVRSLLEHASDAASLAGPGALLLSAILPAVETPESEPDAAPVGERVGRYRITGELGRGGMATVYAAERADGAFRQDVALKVLRRGLDTEDVVRRFLAERQILASLEHPGIAKLLDGGATEDGRPYLVMERVAGRPITAWADDCGLTVRERLELVLRVADAVQYAHRRLVVHRDLKPSNILVGEDGRVKLLDFGIAKLLDPTAGDDGEALTRTGVRPRTPAYASPEQVRGEVVTTASDVYQLGILLYELLTGRRPFTGRGALLESAITSGRVTRPSDATEAGVTRREAGRPDERPFDPDRAEPGIGESGGRAPVGAADPSTPGAASSPEAVARARGTTPDGLRRALKGDLDTIVLMALRKEPEARFGSVEALAEDLRRYLDGRPVLARPDSLGYRTAKFLRRNRWLAPSVAAAVLTLGLYIGTLVRYSVRLEDERDRAELAAAAAEREAAIAREVTGFLTGLFRSGNPYTALQDTITVAGVLEHGAARIRTELVDQPLVRVELLRALADAFAGLGHFQTADSLLYEALALVRATGAAEDDDRTLHVLMQIAGVRIDAFDNTGADTVLRRVLAARLARPETPDTALARLYGLMGMVRRDLGDADSAVALAQRGIELWLAAGDTAGPGYLLGLGALAPALRAAGALDSAEAVYRTLLRRHTELYGPDHIELATTHNNLGYLLRTRGDYAGAEQLYRDALRIYGAVLGPGHPRTMMTRNNLAAVLESAGKPDEVESIARAQIAAVEAEWPAGHWRVGSQYGALGRFFVRRGRFTEAIPLLEANIRSYASTIGGEHDWTLMARAWYGASLLLAGREGEGEAILRAAIAPLRTRMAMIDGDTRNALRQLADVFEANGDAHRAARYRGMLDPD